MKIPEPFGFANPNIDPIGSLLSVTGYVGGSIVLFRVLTGTPLKFFPLISAIAGIARLMWVKDWGRYRYENEECGLGHIFRGIAEFANCGPILFVVDLANTFFAKPENKKTTG